MTGSRIYRDIQRLAEEEAEYMRRYREEHREELAEYQARYREEHREELRAKDRERLQDPERREAMRSATRRWYERNKIAVKVAKEAGIPIAEARRQLAAARDRRAR